MTKDELDKVIELQNKRRHRLTDSTTTASLGQSLDHVSPAYDRRKKKDKPMKILKRWVPNA